MELLSDIQHSVWDLEQRSKVKMRQINFFKKIIWINPGSGGTASRKDFDGQQSFGIDIGQGTHYRNEVFPWTTRMHIGVFSMDSTHTHDCNFHVQHTWI